MGVENIIKQFNDAAKPELFAEDLRIGNFLKDNAAETAMEFRPEYSDVPLFKNISNNELMEVWLAENGIYVGNKKHDLYLHNSQIINIATTVVVEEINLVKRNAVRGAAIGAMGGGFMGSILGSAMGAGIGALTGLVKRTQKVNCNLLFIGYWEVQTMQKHRLVLEFSAQKFNADKFMSIWEAGKSNLSK